MNGTLKIPTVKSLVHALIPARGGSKSVPKKNISPLSGFPLISFSIAQANRCSKISKVVVSTDCEEIQEVASHYGADVPFMRPKSIALDNSLDIEFFRHYIEFLKKSSLDIPELIIHLRPTSPLRDQQNINDAIEYMQNNQAATALRSAHKTHLTPFKMFKKMGESMVPFLTLENEIESANLPRQAFEDTFIPNGYIDIIRTRTLLDSGMLHGKNIKLWETPLVPDIDVWDDFYFAEQYIKEHDFTELLNYMEKLNV